MKFRQWIPLSFFSLVLSSLILSVWSIWSWTHAWNAIFTGIQLTSPLGCDCGVSINFWQHPYLYSFGLMITLGLVVFSAWVSVVMYRSWWNTRRIVKSFVPVTASPEISNLFQVLIQQIFSSRWLSIFVPRLVVFQDSVPRAMSAGFLHPRVFISSAAVEQVPEEELRAILTHELMHVRSLDPVLLWCTSALARLLPARWRFPLESRLQEYIECKTDLEATELVGHAPLGRALLRVASWEQQPAMAAAALMRGAVEKRLHVLAGWVERPEIPWKSILGLSFSVGSLILSAALALQRVDEVYAQEVNSPACMEAESIVYLDHTFVLICPEIPMSVE